jgi:hypothetical protein
MAIHLPSCWLEKQYDGWCEGVDPSGEWFQRLMKIL